MMKIDPWRLTPIGKNIILNHGFPEKVDFVVYKRIKEIDRVTALTQIVDARVLIVGPCRTKRFKYKNRPTTMNIETNGFIIATCGCWYEHKDDVNTITVSFSDLPIFSFN